MHCVKAVFVCDKITHLNPEIAYQRDALPCALLYPPQSPVAVDKSGFLHCPTQPSVRLLSCQAAMPQRNSGLSGQQGQSGRAARYRTGMARKRKRTRQEGTVAAGKHTPCAGRSLTAKTNAGRTPTAVWQTSGPSGPMASRTPEIGKNCPCGKGLPPSGAVGAGSNTSAHLYFADQPEFYRDLQS
jgi:hypothetical protein